MKDKLKRFAELISAQTEERIRAEYPKMNEDYIAADCRVNVKPGRKYTKVDVGSSGKYMVDADGNIFGIKGYGVVHTGHRYGTLDTIDEYLWGHYTGVKRANPL